MIEEVPAPVLLLLGRTAWTDGVEAPPRGELCTWPIGGVITDTPDDAPCG